jgi:hypothetical protein
LASRSHNMFKQCLTIIPHKVTTRWGISLINRWRFRRPRVGPKMIITILFLCIGFNTPMWAQDTGKIPVPVFTSAGVNFEVTYNAVTGLYTYSYSISNPATNTGEIWCVDVDISQPKYGASLSSDGLTIPHGYITDSFNQSVADFKSKIIPMIPVGMTVPTGWGGDLGANGFAGFFSRSMNPKILPGETKGGFQLISRGLPAIRSIEIQPWWIMVLDDEASEKDADIGLATEESLKFTTKTIGPTSPPMELNPIPFLDVIKGYIDECVTLGWLSDSVLVSALKGKLDSAHSFIQADDPSSAKVALGEIMNLINLSTSSQLSPEARGLLFYNTQYLNNALSVTYIK